MTKTAFVFPGQGSQVIGMGKELIHQELFDQASNILGYDLKQTCTEGPEDILRLTTNAQPAIFTVSYMQYLEQNQKPDVLAGHSLGEYTALCAAGVFNFTDAIKIIKKRSELMEAAVPAGKGSMAAIIGLDTLTLEQICTAVKGSAQIANYNSPGQVVVSGETDTIKECCDIVATIHGKKAILLPVSGPFHSIMMKPAAEQFMAFLENIDLQEPTTPIIMNVTADYLRSKDQVKTLLTQQLYSSVRWQQSIEKMIFEKIEIFIEVGPGKVLGGLINKIKKELKK